MLVSTQKYELSMHQPDQLDIWCNSIFNAMKDVPQDDKIGLLEQCIDYLRMQKLEKESLEL